MDRISTKGQMIDQIDLRNVPHSGFDRSNHNYLTGRLGCLIPKRLDEVYPGDRIKGTPEVVTNFEPLAAPLMATMVQKQEQFFVPYIQLWRHAWKFFTGKNGFSDNMPSITPAHLFDVHADVWLHSFMDPFLNELVQDLDYLYYAQDWDSSINGNVFLYQTFENVVENLVILLDSQFSGRKMIDLLEPLVNNVRRFYKDAYIKDTSVFAGGIPTADFESHHKDLNEFDFYTLRFYAPTVYFSNITEFRKFTIDFLRDIVAPFISRAYMFVFGPSSLLDYLGWPIDTKVPHFYFGNPETGVVDSESEDDFAAYYLLQNLLHQSVSSIDVLANISQFHLSHIPLNFMPFKAYFLVWYWNYRDQLLETDILDPEEDEFLGSVITDNVVIYCTIMRQRCWFKDTYTTALTNTGDGNLIVPTGSYDSTDDADIHYYDAAGQLINTTDAAAAMGAGATMCSYTVGNITYKVPTNYLSSIQNQSGLGSNNGVGFISLDVFDRIKRLRSVVQKRLILGYEVDDVVFSSFMVRMSNVRMHIPEILGRGRDTVQMSTLVNNTSTDKQIAGDKTATAWCHAKSSDINYFSEDWGIYIDITTVMPIQSYAGGMQRLYLKREPFDFMWPEFATMGMDAIYNSELSAVGTRLKDSTALQVFGYQGRYYDLKSRQDEEHGRLLTDLNYLTFSREWDEDNPPKLNYQFVHCWPRLDGFVMEDPMEDVFRADCYTGQGWERRLPVPSEIVGR